MTTVAGAPRRQFATACLAIVRRFRAPFLTSFVFAAVLFSFPTPSIASRAPRGLFVIGRDSGLNAYISGWRGELKWAEANPADGVYNWTRIDDLLTAATRYKKQLGLSVVLLSAPPPWVTALPGVKTYQG